jgi:hypothetical protein
VFRRRDGSHASTSFERQTSASATNPLDGPAEVKEFQTVCRSDAKLGLACQENGSWQRLASAPQPMPERSDDVQQFFPAGRAFGACAAAVKMARSPATIYSKLPVSMRSVSRSVD